MFLLIVRNKKAVKDVKLRRSKLKVEMNDQNMIFVLALSKMMFIKKRRNQKFSIALKHFQEAQLKKSALQHPPKFPEANMHKAQSPYLI